MYYPPHPGPSSLFYRWPRSSPGLVSDNEGRHRVPLCMGPGRRYPASLSCLALYLPALLALLWDRCATIRPKVYPIWVSRKEDRVGREQGHGAALDGGYQYGGDGHHRRAFYPRAGESHEAIVHGVSLCLSRLAYGDRRARRRGEHGGGTFSMLS